MVLWFYMQIYLVCRIFESSKGLIFCLICMFLTTDVTKVFQNYLKSATPFPKCYLHKEKWTFDS